MDADVVVIGAGAAGLAAALRLRAQSLQVVVAEARHRVGGRALSQRVSSAVLPAELGAEFIHGQADETRALLRGARIAVIDVGGESFSHEGGGLHASSEDFAHAADILEQAAALREDETVDRFLQRFDGDRAMRAAVQTARAFAEGFDAADPAIASARSIGEEWRSGVDSQIARPLGGYSAMFEYMRAACAAAGVRIELSTRVRRITWSRAGVSVETQSLDAQAQTLRARAAIITLPVGVLRHTGDDDEVRFDPVLPRSKHDALEKIEMGHVVRLVLSFRTAFWERVRGGRYCDAGFFRSTGHPFVTYWTQLPVRNTLIVGWAGGPRAKALTGISQDELATRAGESFGALFDEPAQAREEFDGSVMHDWYRDPFSRGAYSYVVVGGVGARAALAAPVDDTLFFAGEATSCDGQGGTINGALQTGYRAADEAAAALRVKTR